MVIHEYGSHDNPWILLLHPMMTDHTFMLQFVEGMQEDYYVIAPDCSAHGSDHSSFISAQQEAEQTLFYLWQYGSLHWMLPDVEKDLSQSKDPDSLGIWTLYVSDQA